MTAARNRERPRVALMAWGRAFRDPEDTESGARFVFALEGRHREQVFQRFAADPGGAAILREGRSLGARPEKSVPGLSRLCSSPTATISSSGLQPPGVGGRNPLLVGQRSEGRRWAT